MLGALSMSGGHIAMAFDQSFLLALLLLVVGSGLLKGNISAQVGALYPEDDEARRTRGFAIFSMAINFGAVAGPLLCGFLGQRYGWHVGFGLAAIFMLAGLATYLSGYRHLPAKVERKILAAVPMTRRDWKVVAALVAVMALTIFQSIAYYQLGNVLPVWLQDHGEHERRRVRDPDPLVPVDRPLVQHPVACPRCSPCGAGSRRTAASRRTSARSARAPGFARRANLVLVAAIAAAGPHSVLWVWPFLYCAIQGIAFLYYWPTLLALVSRAAPPKINATMMGVAFLTLFVANNLIGWIGTFYEQMTPLAFWADARRDRAPRAACSCCCSARR